MPNLQPLNALDLLRHRLRSEFNVNQAVHAIEWGNPRAMTEALKRVRHDLGGAGNDKPAEDLLQAVLLRFAKSSQVVSFTELKYVCYGSTVHVGRDSWRIIDQHQLFDALLELVNQRADQPKQFRRCYQGLLSGYFGFERQLEAPGDADKRWVSLRAYLADQLDPLREVSSRRGSAPEWLNILSEHRNLLTPDPCTRYADALVRNDQTELRSVCGGLGISSNSWVWDEALMAYVNRVSQADDVDFKERMLSVLELVNGKTTLTLPPTLSIKATSIVVKRYAECREHPEHPVLRDTCVEWIGNPWIKRTAWDAAVNHEPARLMVNSWLKQRLIKDFFGLLAADGAADLRRLDYWLKWEPQISDMWFVLGRNAQENRTAEFLELRKRMAGRDRQLQDIDHTNNAFVMRIGPLLVIEFGVTGNACFIFAAADFRTSLNKRVLTKWDLKQKADATRLSHMTSWEHRFDFELRRLLQSVPASKGELLPTLDTPTSANSTPRLQAPFWPGLNARVPSFTRPTPIPAAPQHSSISSPISDSNSTDRYPAKKHAYEGLQSRPPWPTPPLRGPEAPPGQSPAIHSVSTEKTSYPGTSSAKPSLGKSRISDSELQPLLTLLKRCGIEWLDNRTKGGALWVLLADREVEPHVTSMLESFRFQFKEGKGFWLKEDD